MNGELGSRTPEKKTRRWWCAHGRLHGKGCRKCALVADNGEWIEHRKRRPTEEAWYLVAVAGTRNYMPMVTAAWWNCGRGWGWRDIAGYTGREERMRVLYWRPMIALPPKLQRVVDREFRKAA